MSVSLHRAADFAAKLREGERALELAAAPTPSTAGGKEPRTNADVTLALDDELAVLHAPGREGVAAAGEEENDSITCGDEGDPSTFSSMPSTAPPRVSTTTRLPAMVPFQTSSTMTSVSVRIMDRSSLQRARVVAHAADEDDVATRDLGGTVEAADLARLRDRGGDQTPAEDRKSPFHFPDLHVGRLLHETYRRLDEGIQQVPPLMVTQDLQTKPRRTDRLVTLPVPPRCRPTGEICCRFAACRSQTRLVPTP